MASVLEDHTATFGRNYETAVGKPVVDDDDKGCYFGEKERHKHREPPAIVWIPALSQSLKRRAGTPLAEDPREETDVHGWREFAVEIWCYGTTLHQADVLHHNTVGILNESYGDEDLRLGQFDVVSESEQKAAFNNAGHSVRQRAYLRTYVKGYIDHDTYSNTTTSTAIPSNTGHVCYFGTEDSYDDACGHSNLDF